MRSRRTAHDEVQAIARRRLDLLQAELAGIADDVHVRATPATVPDDPAVDAQTDTGGEHTGPEATARHAGTTLLPGRHARRPVGVGARVGGWAHDRLPPTMQGRVSLGPGHVAVVSLLVAVACALTAWWVVRADGGATLVPAAAPVVTGPATPSGASSGPSVALVTPEAGPDPPSSVAAATVADAVVVVDVAGRVRRPGIVELPAGSRVVDAIDAAGGARPRVDLTSVNLARVLVDGEQIVVGLRVPGGIAASAVSAPGAASGPETVMLVSLNTATQSELEELPGIGPVTATAILQWRSDHGPFTAVDELLEVSGIGEATLAEIAPFVTL